MLRVNNSNAITATRSDTDRSADNPDNTNKGRHDRRRARSQGTIEAQGAEQTIYAAILARIPSLTPLSELCGDAGISIEQWYAALRDDETLRQDYLRMVELRHLALWESCFDALDQLTAHARSGDASHSTITALRVRLEQSIRMAARHPSLTERPRPKVDKADYGQAASAAFKRRHPTR